MHLSQNLLLPHSKPSTAPLHMPFPQSPARPGMKPGWLKCHLWLCRCRLGEGNQAPQHQNAEAHVWGVASKERLPQLLKLLSCL